jgi:hypothetical protein
MSGSSFRKSVPAARFRTEARNLQHRYFSAGGKGILSPSLFVVFSRPDENACDWAFSEFNLCRASFSFIPPQW